MRTSSVHARDIHSIAIDHQKTGLTMRDGLAALRAAGAIQEELHQYTLERSLVTLSRIAKSVGFEIVVSVIEDAIGGGE